MSQLSNLFIRFCVASFASLASCRPSGEDTFDLIQQKEDLSIPDFSLLPSGGSIEDPFQLPVLGSGSIEPLLTSSFNEPIITAYSFDSDLDPHSSQLALIDSASSIPTLPFPLLIADGTLCPGENRHAFCCKGEKCVKTAKCYTDEDQVCCTVDDEENDDKTPYNCQPPSAPLSQKLQSIPEFFSELFDESSGDFNSGFLRDFSGELSGNFPGDLPINTSREPGVAY